MIIKDAWNISGVWINGREFIYFFRAFNKRLKYLLVPIDRRGCGTAYGVVDAGRNAGGLPLKSRVPAGSFFPGTTEPIPTTRPNGGTTPATSGRRRTGIWGSSSPFSAAGSCRRALKKTIRCPRPGGGRITLSWGMPRFQIWQAGGFSMPGRRPAMSSAWPVPKP